MHIDPVLGIRDRVADATVEVGVVGFVLEVVTAPNGLLVPGDAVSLVGGPVGRELVERWLLREEAWVVRPPLLGATGGTQPW